MRAVKVRSILFDGNPHSPGYKKGSRFHATQTTDQTLVLIKPDALKNSLTGYVLSLLSEYHTGLRFAGVKVVHVNSMLAEEHYAEHKGKIFYPSLLEYIMGRLHYADDPWKRRVIALVYQGPDAIKKIREIAGPTNPLSAREKNPGASGHSARSRPSRTRPERLLASAWTTLSMPPQTKATRNGR